MRRVCVDRENVNDEFVVVRKVYKRSGEVAVADEVVLDIETSKTMTEICSPEGGVLSIAVKAGDEVSIGALLFEVGTADASETVATRIEGALAADGQRDIDSAAGSTQRLLSRAAQALAERSGIDIQSIPTRGWVTSADVSAALGGSCADIQGIAAVATSSTPLRDSGSSVGPKNPFHTDRRTLRKRVESRNLQRANGNGTTSMVSIELLISGLRLASTPFLFGDSISDLVVFEGARLLRRYPELNAFHVDERNIGYFDEVNFGITFDSGRNLKVLALQNADMLSLAAVQAGFDRLLQLYESEAQIDEALLTSSTVTLSDLSRSPVDLMFPLLDLHQSMILGITRVTAERYRLHASFDHRVSEGLQVARFLGELRERIQSHFRPSPGAHRLGSLRCSVCDQSMQVEVSLGGRGLMRIVLPDGTDGYLCRNCFRGW